MAGLEGVAMEAATAEERRPLEVCISDVKSCDVFVGLFAHRYGSIPAGEAQSFTELEYRAAGEAGIARLLFLIDDDQPWLTRFLDEHTGDNESGRRIGALKAELLQMQNVLRFTTPDDLAGKVAGALFSWWTTREAERSVQPASSVVDSATRNYLLDCIAREKDLHTSYVALSGTAKVPIVSPAELPRQLLPRSFRVVRSENTPGNGKTEQIVSSVSEVLERFPRVVILGDPGSGKTTTLHDLLFIQARAALGGGGAVPLLVNLAQWPESIPDLGKLLVHERAAQSCPLLPPSQMFVLLDGLNEIPAELYASRLESIQRWLDMNPQARVIGTSRAEHYLHSVELKLPIVTLHPLSDSQVEQFVARWLDAPGAERFLDRIGWHDSAQKGVRHLAQLASNPFQLLLMCHVFLVNRGQLPSTRGELLRTFVQTSYQREADGHRDFGLSYDDFVKGLGGLALSAIKMRSSTALDIKWAARQVAGPAGFDAVRALAQGTNLARLTKNGRFLEFTHQLVLEYFAAEELVRDLDRMTEALLPSRFRMGERQSQAADEVCSTAAELHSSVDEALLAIGRIDPFLAVDIFIRSERVSTVSLATRRELTYSLLDRASQGAQQRLAVLARARSLGEASVASLQQLLTDGNKVQRRFAAEVLGTIESLAAVESLVTAALEEDDRWLRRAATDALQRLRASYPTLIDRFLRECLGQFGSETAAVVDLLTVSIPAAAKDLPALEHATGAQAPVVQQVPVIVRAASASQRSKPKPPDKRGRARSFEHQGMWTEAAAEYKVKLATEEARGHVAGMVFNAKKLGLIMRRRLDDLPGARRVLLKALAVAFDARYVSTDVAACLSNLGSICRDEGDLVGAAEYYERALRFSEGLFDGRDATIGHDNFDRRGTAIAHDNLGVISALLGRRGEAEAHFETALKLDIASGSPIGIANSRANLGVLYWGDGRSLEAESAFGEADRLFLKINNTELAEKLSWVRRELKQDPNHLRRQLFF